MSTLLEFGRDVQGYNAYAPQPSTNMFSATLSNGAASTITIPATFQQWVVSFSVQPGCNIWVDFTGATAAAPVGGTFAASTSELNPGARLISTYANNQTSVKTISIITDNTTADVSVAFYGVQYAN